MKKCHTIFKPNYRLFYLFTNRKITHFYRNYQIVWTLHLIGKQSRHDSTLVSGASCSKFDSQRSQKIVDVAEVNQWCCLEESGQWPENADQTHLVLASKHYKNMAEFFSISKKCFQLFCWHWSKNSSAVGHSCCYEQGCLESFQVWHHFQTFAQQDHFIISKKKFLWPATLQLNVKKYPGGNVKV